MSITFHADGRVTGNSAGNFGSSGQIIQTVIGANGGGSGSSIAITSSYSQIWWYLGGTKLFL